VQRDLKVLVCAPSNIAVDTILARLADSSASTSGTENVSKGRKGGGAKSDNNSNSGSDYLRKLNMVRLGHPARISANILKYSLDSLIESDEV
jgi:superfamily I DNA and/or RNA helicase